MSEEPSVYRSRPEKGCLWESEVERLRGAPLRDRLSFAREEMRNWLHWAPFLFRSDMRRPTQVVPGFPPRPSGVRVACKLSLRSAFWTGYRVLSALSIR